MKILWTILLFAVLSFGSSLTWETLIGSVNDDPVLNAADRRINSVSQGASTKLWDDLEFRYQLNGLGFLEHDFELRLKPNPWGETKATSEYWDAMETYQKARKAVDRSYIMYERYERGLRFVIQERIQKINRELFQVNKDRIEVLRMKSGAEGFDLQSLISAREREAEISAALVADSNALLDIEMKFRSWIPEFDQIQLDSAWLPSIEQIEKFLKEASSPDSAYPQIAQAKSKWNASEKRYHQESATDNDMFSYIGFGYKHVIAEKKYKWEYVPGSYSEKEWILIRSEDDRRLIDKFYINLALKLPWFTDNSDGDMRRQISVLDDESDYLEVRRDLTQKAARIREEMAAIIAQRNIQKEFVREVDAGQLFQDFAMNAGSDPLLLLRAREVALESTLKQVRLEYEIYSRFFILLDYAGIFSRENLLNHLQVGL
ncbi:MAG: hypothetical protein LBR60_01440 [Fibrobacter sp.]|jgi:hypothetical protein|nr:hypothetical protein [Fibrobacter sp.]